MKLNNPMIRAAFYPQKELYVRKPQFKSIVFIKEFLIMMKKPR